MNTINQLQTQLQPRSQSQSQLLNLGGDIDQDELCNLPDFYDDGKRSSKYSQGVGMAASIPSSQPNAVQTSDICQWEVGPNNTFRAAAHTVRVIPPDSYSVDEDMRGIYLRTKRLMTDELVELPDGVAIKAMNSIRKFWLSKPRYKKYGLLYKRGCFFYGPPGGGKTSDIHLLCGELITSGGIVVFCDNPQQTARMLNIIRTVEPDRALIVVMEDIDELIKTYGEHDILAMLDGEHQIDNCIFLATSNYPERLGARIINRPSRFDDRIRVGMPTLATRLAYLRKTTSCEDGFDEVRLNKWAVDTDGLSVAHLRELVAAVLCLEQDYDEVLKRLRSMRERIKEEDGMKENNRIGFEIK